MEPILLTSLRIDFLVDEYFKIKDPAEALGYLDKAFFREYFHLVFTEHKRSEKENIQNLDKLWHELAEKIDKRRAELNSWRQHLLSTDKEYPAWIPAPIKKTGFIGMLKRCNAIE